jgi:hypothetical protein
VKAAAAVSAVVSAVDLDWFCLRLVSNIFKWFQAVSHIVWHTYEEIRLLYISGFCNTSGHGCKMLLKQIYRVIPRTETNWSSEIPKVHNSETNARW